MKKSLIYEKKIDRISDLSSKYKYGPKQTYEIGETKLFI